ncbi:hypothetical protein RYX36_034758 [Vicia faba]
MLRDSKIPRRNLGKQGEVENVDPTDSCSSGTNSRCTEASRPPLNTIQDTDVSCGSSKFDKTPSKTNKRKVGPELRTPEKSLHWKHRFAWPQRIETVSSMIDDRRGSGIGNGTPKVTRNAGRACSESNSTNSTPTKSVTKPPPSSSVRGKADGSFSARLGNYAALYKGVSSTSCTPPTVVNTVEVPHFDLKEDSSFWINHNVQVIIRVRPLNSMERSIHNYNRCLKQEGSQCITWIGQPENRFTFDHVACETVDQDMVFRMAGLPMVENCLSGYNSCMFAYGQTGSGKTYTMLGEIEDLDVKPSSHRGMTPRIFEFLFARIQAEEESRRDENLKYNCKCSFLEIYNEQITDLLDPSSTNLLLREDVKKGGVYVENLSEFEAQSVSDIIRLLIQGMANRKVAATNMNRESSRSHCVFTCVIESTWEKDSTTNYRFARLNLVDLAGSERQKTSGAEGERLKEAASINKSLSTLGHVIMILVDVANGKQRHIPYRDSRLTFLLQDSLGGNSKTMIIANVSPSICCAAETLNTLKFAQRAKLIQNNAVVNEDSSGDVIALKHQIRLLKEEISTLKRCQSVSRSLSFRDIKQSVEDYSLENETEMAEQQDADMLDYESKGTRMSHKQLESLQTTLDGALRREQIAETSIRQLEAEVELLNSLVRQREEETMSCKMMLRFREDKIRRLESQAVGSITGDQFLHEDNKALSDEIQLLQGKIDQNPEVTRFAKENIRLQEQLRRYEEFYGEGEREILLSEVSSLREQLLQFLGGKSVQADLSYDTQPQKTQCCSKQNDSIDLELRNALDKLEEYRHNLNYCLEENAKLHRELDSLQSMFNNKTATKVSIKEPLSKSQALPPQMAVKHESQLLKETDDILDLHLELDIIKIILKEERTSREILEEGAMRLNHEILMEKDKLLQAKKQLEDTDNELKVAKSVIEALESQQILSIKEIEDMQNKNNNYQDLVRKQEREIIALKNQLAPSKVDNEYPLQVRFRRMHDSLEKAKQLNMFYQSDRALQISNEEEMDEVRRQAEAETAEVIVCMQEELAQLQHQVNDSHQKEIEMKESILHLETELKDVKEKLLTTVDDNQSLSEEFWQRDNALKSLVEEWELLTSEIEEILGDGCQALDDASDELGHISNSLPQKRIWISEQVSMMVRKISEKELLIDELGRCLEDACNKRSDMECMLKSLRSATLVITEAHQKESAELEKEILLLTSQVSERTTTLKQMEEQFILARDQIRKTSTGATAAFVVVNRLSDVNDGYLVDVKHKDNRLNELAEINDRKDAVLIDQSTSLEQAKRQIAELQEKCDNLWQRLSEEKEHSFALEHKLEDIEKSVISEAREQLVTLQDGVFSIRSSMASFANNSNCLENGESRTSSETHHQIAEMADLSFKLANSGYDKKNRKARNVSKDACERDVTITLLRKEIESALESLKEVHAEIAKLHEEKKGMSICEKQSRDSIKCLTTQILALQAAVGHFEEQSEVKVEVLSKKLRNLEKTLKEAMSYWNQTKESLELEVGEAKIVQVQKAEETYCILAKFEEAQDTMKEADIMINELVIANQSMKIDIEKLKEREVTLLSEKDVLINKVESLQTVVDLKHREIEDLVESNLIETRDLVLEVDDVITEVQLAMKEIFTSLACDIECLKSQFICSTKSIQPWLEKIWSEIVNKDCAMSVLHLCHMSVLLETVTGMHAANGLLSHGLCESNSVISDLKEHNCRTREELEMCRTLKGKLLADIQSSFDRISRKEVEAGEITIKLNTFAKKLSDLQLQEEMMLQRSNEMGSQLAMLMRELDLSNTDLVVSLLDQEKLLKQKVEATESQAEFLMADWYAKDFELLIRSSEFSNMACNVSEMEEHFVKYSTLIEQLKTETIFFQVETELAEQILMDKEVEVSLLKREVQQEKKEKENLLMELKQNILRITEMGEVNKALEQKIDLLKDTESQAEFLMADWYTKDFELLIHSSEFSNMACNISDMEEHFVKYSTLNEQLKTEAIFFQVKTELAEQILMDKEVEISLLKREVQQEKIEMENILMELKQNILRITEMGEVNKALEQNIDLLKDTESQAEFLMADWYAKDFELLIHSSEFSNMACNISDMEEHFVKYSTLNEQLKTEAIFFQVKTELAEQILMDKEVEISLLKREVQQEKIEMENISMELKQNILRITEMGEVNKALEQNIDLLKDTESQAEFLMEDWYAKDFELLVRASEFRIMTCNISDMEDHFVKYSTLIEQLKKETIFFQVETELAEQILMDKEIEVSLLKREVQQEKEEKKNLLMELKQNILRITKISEVNKELEQNIELLKDVSCSNIAWKGELVEVKESEKRLLDEIRDLEVDYDRVIGDALAKNVASEFAFHHILFLEDQFRELQSINVILESSCCKLKNELHLRDSEIDRIQSLLQLELSRKEDVIKGLLYDLSLLQESASTSKDQKDEMEEMMAIMEEFESELTIKSDELASVVANCRLFETQLMDKSNRVIALELDLSKECEVVKQQVSEIDELRTHIEDALVARKLVEEELKERKKITESLENEILEMSNVLGQMNDSIKNLSVDRDALTIQRDQLEGQVILLKEGLENAAAQAEANEAIAQDAQKMAEARKVYAEDKEAEIELLERSVEELESTINVLEENVDFIKGEAERQRLQREELETELCALKEQMQNLRNANDDTKRFLDGKEKSLEEAQNHIQFLKSDIAGKDAEVAQMKAHISELNLHAEAQAMEYKQKFKALEAMVEQVKPEGISTQSTNALSNKSEKNATKSRGSGSPFKCIGLGLAQQVKNEKVEELSAAKLHIEELESQAACRQKEIFSLNARLATAESMTHDVIRDLLGVKLDMTSYVSLLDNHQVQKIAEKAQFLTLEPKEKEQEVTKLRRQLNEFIEERKGWLEDINRKQAELVAAQNALENLRQRDQSLKDENELLRMENASKMSKVMELEEEIKKLSGQQNLQQRIHHHAKIKEENNTLKIQNEQLSAKLRRSNHFMSRVQEDIARLRASTGSKHYIDFDQEQRLRKMVKETEEEKIQLAQQLLRLSTNVLKAAGIAKPVSDVNPTIAEKALEELKNRITSLEMEHEDLKFKNKIMIEKIRLSELMPQASPLSSRSEENKKTPPKANKAPFLSSFDRY